MSLNELESQKYLNLLLLYNILIESLLYWLSVHFVLMFLADIVANIYIFLYIYLSCPDFFHWFFTRWITEINSLNLGNIPIGISVSYQVPYLEDTLQINKLNNKKTSSRCWFRKTPAISEPAIAVIREPRESPALFSVWSVPVPSWVFAC